MIGKRFHNYHVLEKIGEGGMGIVYKAHDTKLNRTVVLKFLSHQEMPDTEAKERFIQEARAAAALNHPNIITVYEINEIEGQMYIAMEYVEGLTLRDKFINSTPTNGMISVSTKDIIQLSLQICNGLSRAHRKGIIHRDIKPQNIMVNNENLVKILDFGTAKLKKVRKLTKNLCIMGTLFYMSPEQLNCEEVDQRADIWSLGVVLFEILTGKLPFKGATAEEICYSILTQEPETITAFCPGMPQELGRIVNKALAKNRDERYRHMEALMKDFLALEGPDAKTAALPEAFSPTRTPHTPHTPLTKPILPISIAVLPFVDLSPQQDQEYFCDGISEELITVLTKIEKLKVASRTSAFQFKNKNSTLEEICAALKVQYILEGSVQKSNKRLRITTKLINTVDGCPVWSERFDRKTKDIFAIQDEITLAVAEYLKLKLLGTGKARLVKHHTCDQEAYNLYLKGRYFWNRRYEGGLKKSIEYYRQALRLDDQYALPYVGIADSLNILGMYGFLPPAEAFTQAQNATQKALGIDDELPEAFTSLGWINNFYNWDWEESEKHFQHAIELNPNYATSYEWYALSLATRGYLEDARERAGIALTLDPLSLIINSVLGIIYIFSRRYPQAEEQLKKTLEMDPNFLLANIWLGDVYSLNQKYLEAEEEYQKALAISSDMTYVLSSLGYTYAISGQKSKAEKIIETFDRMGSELYISPVQKAQVHIGLGNIDLGFELLETANHIRDPFCLWVNVHPFFDGLHSEPRFNRLLKNIGF